MNPREQIKLIDATKHKKHELPFHGQKYQQIHNLGGRVVSGHVIGLDVKYDVEGIVVAWSASVDTGFRQPFKINHSDTWRSAADWHAAPAAEQLDFNIAVADLERQLAKQASTIQDLLERLEAFAKVDDVQGAVESIQDRLDALETPVEPEADRDVATDTDDD